MSQLETEKAQAAGKQAALSGWAIAALASMLAVLYLLLHPYVGLIHDARMYTLMALSRLHPDLFGADIFLRFGSQDDYTLFSPLYAWTISLLGTEAAASLITLMTAAAFLGAAWWLARSLMSAKLSWLAVGLLIVVPASYGSAGIFTALEGYISPRQLAECLVLLSVAAWLRNRAPLAIAVLSLGFLIHPIMAFPGAILLLALTRSLQRWRVVLPAALAAIFIAAAAQWDWLPVARWQFDSAWRAVLGYGSYLKLANWSAYDWAGVSNVVITLGVAAFSLTAATRRLAIGMLLSCVALLALSWTGCDLLHLVVVTQGQAWRVLWLAQTIAILLLPCIVATCWQDSDLRRCSALLLMAAWIIGSKPLALIFSIPALICAAGGGLHLAQRHERLAVRGALIVFAVTLAANLAVAWLDSMAAPSNPAAATWFARLAEGCSNGALPAFLLLGVWYCVTNVRTATAAAGLLVVLLLPVSLIARSAITPWTTTVYTPEAKASLTAWRNLIPPGSEVIWAANLLPRSEPMGAWLLLERPSYFSTVQSATGLFSRAAALELHRRSQAIPPGLPVEYPYTIVPGGPITAAPSCRDIPAKFIVTQVTIPDALMHAAPASTPAPFNRLRLFICP